MTTPMDIPQMTDEKKEPFEDRSSSLPPKENLTPPTSTDQPQDLPTEPPAKTQEQLLIEEYQRKEQQYQQRQRETDARLAQLTETVGKLVEEKNAPPALTPEEEAKEFYKDPKKVIREVMQETVKPLNEFKDEYQGTNAYTRLKNQFKSDPRFAQYFNRPGFEQMVDQVVSQSQQNGIAISEQFVESVYTHAAGQIAVGTVQMPDPIADANRQGTPPQETPPVDNRQIPPYLAPSAPPMRKPTSDGPKRRQLTENEDRIRRENKMSIEEWWAWMDEDSKNVVDSQIGISQEKK